MITEIKGIHGSSSKITFELENARVTASGEFFARDGKISGFVVSKASLKYENGEWLTDEEQEELLRKYAKYADRPNAQKSWTIEFD